MRSGTKAALAAILGLAVACGRPDQVVEEAPDTTPSMPDMTGMEMGPQSAPMRDMTAHMEMMGSVSGDSAVAILPTHRQMLANMIAQMNREMRDMNMPSDVAWTATVDSLRSDLVAMPEMSAAELQAFMPDHRTRVMRLMDMHRDMMRRVGM